MAVPNHDDATTATPDRTDDATLESTAPSIQPFSFSLVSNGINSFISTIQELTDVAGKDDSSSSLLMECPDTDDEDQQRLIQVFNTDVRAEELLPIPGGPAITEELLPMSNGAAIAELLPMSNGPAIAELLPMSNGPAIAELLPMSNGAAIADEPVLLPVVEGSSSGSDANSGTMAELLIELDDFSSSESNHIQWYQARKVPILPVAFHEVVSLESSSLGNGSESASDLIHPEHFLNSPDDQNTSCGMDLIGTVSPVPLGQNTPSNDLEMISVGLKSTSNSISGSEDHFGDEDGDDVYICKTLNFLEGAVTPHIKTVTKDDIYIVRDKLSHDVIAGHDQWGEILEANRHLLDESSESSDKDLLADARSYFKRVSCGDLEHCATRINLNMKPLIRRYYERALEQVLGGLLLSTINDEEDFWYERLRAMDLPWKVPDVWQSADRDEAWPRCRLWQSFRPHCLIEGSQIIWLSQLAARKILKLRTAHQNILEHLPKGINDPMINDIPQLMIVICECILSIDPMSVPFYGGMIDKKRNAFLQNALAPCQELIIEANTLRFSLPASAISIVVWHEKGLMRSNDHEIIPISWHRGEGLSHCESLSLDGEVKWLIMADSGHALCGILTGNKTGHVIVITLDGMVLHRYAGFKGVPEVLTLTRQYLLVRDDDLAVKVISLEGRVRGPWSLAIDPSMTIVKSSMPHSTRHILVRDGSNYGVSKVEKQEGLGGPMTLLMLETFSPCHIDHVIQVEVLDNSHAILLLIVTDDHRLVLCKGDEVIPLLSDWQVQSLKDVHMTAREGDSSCYSMLIDAISGSGGIVSLLVDIHCRPSGHDAITQPETVDHHLISARVVASWPGCLSVSIMGARSPLERCLVALTNSQRDEVILIEIPTWRAIRNEARSASQKVAERYRLPYHRIEEGLWRLLMAADPGSAHPDPSDSNITEWTGRDAAIINTAINLERGALLGWRRNILRVLHDTLGCAANVAANQVDNGSTANQIYEISRNIGLHPLGVVLAYVISLPPTSPMLLPPLSARHYRQMFQLFDVWRETELASMGCRSPLRDPVGVSIIDESTDEEETFVYSVCRSSCPLAIWTTKDHPLPTTTDFDTLWIALSERIVSTSLRSSIVLDEQLHMNPSARHWRNTLKLLAAVAEQRDGRLPVDIESLSQQSTSSGGFGLNECFGLILRTGQDRASILAELLRGLLSSPAGPVRYLRSIQYQELEVPMLVRSEDPLFNQGPHRWFFSTRIVLEEVFSLVRRLDGQAYLGTTEATHFLEDPRLTDYKTLLSICFHMRNGQEPPVTSSMWREVGMVLAQEPSPPAPILNLILLHDLHTYLAPIALHSGCLFQGDINDETKHLVLAPPTKALEECYPVRLAHNIDALVRHLCTMRGSSPSFTLRARNTFEEVLRVLKYAECGHIDETESVLERFITESNDMLLQINGCSPPQQTIDTDEMPRLCSSYSCSLLDRYFDCIKSADDEWINRSRRANCARKEFL